MFAKTLALCFIALVTGLLYLALRWFQKRGLVGPRGMLWLNVLVFSAIFLTSVFAAYDDPLPPNPMDAVMRWSVLLLSPVIVAISSIRIARTR